MSLSPLLFSLISATACGYRSAVLRSAIIEIESVTARAPHPAVSECLTRELRLGLATRSSAPRDAQRFIVQADLVEASVSPGALTRRGDGLRPLDQAVELILTVRIQQPRHGTVWGPTSYRVDRSALQGSEAVSSWSSAGSAMDRACHEVARDIVDDVTSFFLEIE